MSCLSWYTMRMRESDKICWTYGIVPVHYEPLRESAKKVIFLVARPLRPYPPPPSLVATFFGGGFFLEFQKKFFLLSGQALSPLPPLTGQESKKKNLFFAASLGMALFMRVNLV